LRLAEDPCLYAPRWSSAIIDETVRNLESRIGLSAAKTAYLVAQLREHFGDSWVTGYEPLTGHMTNDPSDRHVLAAAVKCGAPLIVAYSKRHFPAAAVEPWGIGIQGPSAFLKRQYVVHPQIVTDKLHAQARNLCRTLPEQLTVLRKAVPSFVDAICQDLGTGAP
jgi:hypothetical protein